MIYSAMLALGVSVTLLSPVVAQAQERRGPPTAVIVGGPSVGRKAPDFSLPWANKDTVGPADQPFSLWKTLGKPVVLVFYPRDFTPGATSQLQSLAERHDELVGKDVVLVGIGVDSAAAHQRFSSSLGLPFALLSDPDQSVARKYAAREGDGYNRRAVYVIGRDGRVQYRNLRFAANAKDYAELKAAIRRAAGSA